MPLFHQKGGYWYDCSGVIITPPPPPPSTVTATATYSVLGVGGTNTRDSLVYGAYQPSTSGTFGTSSTSATAGLLDASLLTAFNSASTQTLTLTDGQQIDNKTIYGNIRPPGLHNTNIVLTNCLLRGGPNAPTSDDSVVNCQNTRSGTGKVILIDCEIWPQVPQLLLDGVRGNRHESYRVWIHDTIDGWESHAYTNQNGGNCLTGLYGSVIENLRYMNPDNQHSDGTHNDCLALNGGKQVHVQGNYLRGTSTNLPGTQPNPTDPQLAAAGYNAGAIALCTNTVGNPPDLTVIVEENYCYGAKSRWNIKPGIQLTIRKNKHYRACFVGSTSSGYWIRYDYSGAVYPGGNYPTVCSSDTWIDGPYAGNVLTTPQQRGIQYNPS